MSSEFEKRQHWIAACLSLDEFTTLVCGYCDMCGEYPLPGKFNNLYSLEEDPCEGSVFAYCSACTPAPGEFSLAHPYCKTDAE